MIMMYHLYSIETIKRGEVYYGSILQLFELFEINSKHFVCIQFKFPVTLIPFVMSSFATFVSYDTFLAYNEHNSKQMKYKYQIFMNKEHERQDDQLTDDGLDRLLQEIHLVLLHLFLFIFFFFLFLFLFKISKKTELSKIFQWKKVWLMQQILKNPLTNLFIVSVATCGTIQHHTLPSMFSFTKLFLVFKIIPSFSPFYYNP